MDDSVIDCTMLDSVEFGEHEKKTIHIKISSKFVGYLRIVGIAGKISSAADKVQIWGKLSFDKIPIKMDSTSVKQDFDRKLEIQILPPISALQVKFSDVPKEVLGGEVFPVSIELLNTGPNVISDIYVATNSPKHLIFEPATLIEMPLSIEKGEVYISFRISFLINNLFCRPPRYFNRDFQQRQRGKKAVRDKDQRHRCSSE